MNSNTSSSFSFNYMHREERWRPPDRSTIPAQFYCDNGNRDIWLLAVYVQYQTNDRFMLSCVFFMYCDDVPFALTCYYTNWRWQTLLNSSPRNMHRASQRPNNIYNPQFVHTGARGDLINYWLAHQIFLMVDDFMKSLNEEGFKIIWIFTK